MLMFVSIALMVLQDHHCNWPHFHDSFVKQEKGKGTASANEVFFQPKSWPFPKPNQVVLLPKLQQTRTENKKNEKKNKTKNNKGPRLKVVSQLYNNKFHTQPGLPGKSPVLHPFIHHDLAFWSVAVMVLEHHHH